MPFRKVGRGKYRSPSGRKFTKKQVNLYYLTGGFKNMRKATRLKKRRRKKRRR